MAPIETFEHNGFTITIDYDQSPSNPRDDTHGCELVMRARNHDFPNDAGIDFAAFGGWSEIAETLRNDHDAVMIKSVYMLDHSGIALSTWDFADPWDSAQVGLAYVTRENWRETQQAEWENTQVDRELANSLMMGDVETYGQYVNGEVYSYVITDASGEVDADNGFYGIDSVTEEAKQSADARTPQAAPPVKVIYTLTDAEQFFYDNAGSSHNLAYETEQHGKIMGAMSLAEAENRAKLAGAYVEWELDPDADNTPSEGYFVSGNPQWQAALRDSNGEFLESLCGIDFAEAYEVTPESDPYARVVAAELAQQAISEGKLR